MVVAYDQWQPAALMSFCKEKSTEAFIVSLDIGYKTHSSLFLVGFNVVF